MRRTFLVISLLIVALLGNLLFFVVDRDTKQLDLARLIPLRIGCWHGRDLKLQNYVYKILGSKNVLSREYHCGDKVIFLTVVMSDKDRRVIHPPEVCLKGGGQRVINKKIKKLSFCKLKVNQLVLLSNPKNTIIWYWYAIGNKFTTNYYYYQLNALLERLKGKPKHSYLLRVSFEDGQQDIAKSFMSKFVTLMRERL